MWLQHNGGECPVDEMDIVTVRERSGYITRSVEARLIDWEHNNEHDDIVAYKIDLHE